MVIKNSEMKTQIRHELKGGNGDIHFLNYADCSEFKNCRLLSEMTIPVNASIGEHTHIAETEYYIVLSGKGLVVDNGSEKVVESKVIFTSRAPALILLSIISATAASNE